VKSKPKTKKPARCRQCLLTHAIDCHEPDCPQVSKKRTGTNFVGHEWVLRVEAKCPGESVIAGPFWVDHYSSLARKEERQMAVNALLTQRQAHPEARMVMFRGRAFVLRPTKGWLMQGKEGTAVVVKGSKKRRAAK
jgi:hypothetical protein